METAPPSEGAGDQARDPAENHHALDNPPGHALGLPRGVLEIPVSACQALLHRSAQAEPGVRNAPLWKPLYSLRAAPRVAVGNRAAEMQHTPSARGIAKSKGRLLGLLRIFAGNNSANKLNPVGPGSVSRWLSASCNLAPAETVR